MKMIKTVLGYVLVLLIGICSVGGLNASDEVEPVEIGIAFGFDFNLYVTDPVHDRILQYDTDFNYLGCFFDGKNNEYGWVMENPISISTDYHVSIIRTIDSKQKRGFQFDTTGIPYQNQFELDRNEVVEPWDIASTEIYDDIGNYAVDREGNKLLRYDPPSISFEKIELHNICCLLRFTIPDGYESSPAHVGDSNGEFDHPEGVAVDNRGYVLVADTGNNRIQRFRRNGEFICQFGHSGDEFELDTPVDIISDYNDDSQNRLYIADRGNHRIVITTEFGEFIDEIKPTDKDGYPILDYICAVAIDTHGDIWVSESTEQALYRFNSLDSDYPLRLSGSMKNILDPSFQVKDATIRLKKFFAEIESKTVPIKPYAQIIDDRTMIPVRWLMENFYTQTSYDPKYTSTVTWDADECKATIFVPEIAFGYNMIFRSKTIELWQGEPTAQVNGDAVTIDPDNPNVTVQTIGDRLFVPLRFIAENLDTEVTWIPADSQPKSRKGIVRLIFPDISKLKSNQ